MVPVFGFFFFISFFFIVLVLFGYPGILYFLTLAWHRNQEVNLPVEFPLFSVSMIIALRNSERIIERKIQNCLDLTYPSNDVEIIFSLDGSTDRTEEILRRCPDKRLRVISFPEHQGKVSALNRAVEQATKDLLVFSDADSILEKDALMKMLRHFSDEAVGGVCGQRVIYKDSAEMKTAQKRYIKFDSAIKVLENKLGSLTSNDGKLYGIRRSLFWPIHPSAVDDLFVSLSVIRQGYRFGFEPEAKVFIHVPSRSVTHEIIRRRRIVSTSLRCLFMMREIFNPVKFGFYSFELFVNKVLRRFLPIFLMIFFSSNLTLAFVYGWAMGLWIVQVLGYGFAAIFPVLDRIPWRNRGVMKLKKLSSVLFYFCVGNMGTFLGFLDFLRGKEVKKWEPVKG